MTDDVVRALIVASRSAAFDARDEAAMRMANHLDDSGVRRRLVEMLDDPDIAVQVSAVESLATRGGRSGIEAILHNLGVRIDDPDADSMVGKLQELQGWERAPILQTARVLISEGTTPATERAIEELERLFGHYVEQKGLRRNYARDLQKWLRRITARRRPNLPQRTGSIYVQCAVFIPTIQNFVNHELSVEDFEAQYLRLVNDWPASLDPAVSGTVNQLFIDIDAFVSDEALRGCGDLDEQQLRLCAQDALSELIELQRR
ncbi:colicin immunity domain-containing protein [Rhodococcus sp. H36-A4]|uniref:colicin immunity domain-containing protein n=1 Tax=unclassified Rhodococcus (in: high G+C Gram-positive bacteria) TaxID=192944 RepID=UPI000A0AA14C|nr:MULTISPECIES: colicin immunity domain-containing protein [unclassified Rhodococcus (in: high G+C Gram-positive bacteria)]MCZ4080285.1 colicin immunity domain-containing protein [Rhodococcus sp. H36-A4]ORI21119.1 hypothetical protein BJI47_16855 [Rhodococcus sp. 1168]